MVQFNFADPFEEVKRRRDKKRDVSRSINNSITFRSLVKNSVISFIVITNPGSVLLPRRLKIHRIKEEGDLLLEEGAEEGPHHQKEQGEQGEEVPLSNFEIHCFTLGKFGINLHLSKFHCYLVFFNPSSLVILPLNKLLQNNRTRTTVFEIQTSKLNAIYDFLILSGINSKNQTRI